LIDTLVAVVLLTASTLSWHPGPLYGGGGPAVTYSLPAQVIDFAPTTSTPFYTALEDSQKKDGCTLPQEWRKKYGHAYPVTMIIQGMTNGQPNWHLTAKPWSFKNVGGYVRLLCPELHARLSGEWKREFHDQPPPVSSGSTFPRESGFLCGSNRLPSRRNPLRPAERRTEGRE